MKIEHSLPWLPGRQLADTNLTRALTECFSPPGPAKPLVSFFLSFDLLPGHEVM